MAKRYLKTLSHCRIFSTFSEDCQKTCIREMDSSSFEDSVRQRDRTRTIS